MATATKVRRARGERRRRELLEAALVVIDQRGVQATTHRAVAEAAGVPLATTTYYFESIDHLLEDALLLFVSEEATRLRALAEQLRDTTASPIEIAEMFAHELADGSPWPVPLKRVQWELYLEASRRPRLQAAAQQCVATYVEVAEAALRAAGAPRAAAGARLFVAMTDGLGLHAAFAAEDEGGGDAAGGDALGGDAAGADAAGAAGASAVRESSTLADALLELFIPFAMSAEEHAAWERRLRAPHADAAAPAP